MLERCWAEMRAANACYIADRYDHDRSPASQLASRDGWLNFIDGPVQHAIEHGHPSLPADFSSRKPVWDGVKGGDSSAEWWAATMEYESEATRALGLDFRTHPTHIVHWAAAYGSGHWFNPHIGLHLAARVCPEVQWRVLEGCDHTTVVSADGRHVFDLLAWGYDRLGAGRCRVEDDSTLGGAEAVRRARMPCQCGQHS